MRRAVELDVPIPAGVEAGPLIGRGGRNVKAIAAESGARVNVDSERGTVRLRGPAQAVQLANQRLQDIFKSLLEQSECPSTPAPWTIELGVFLPVGQRQADRQGVANPGCFQLGASRTACNLHYSCLR